MKKIVWITRNKGTYEDDSIFIWTSRVKPINHHPSPKRVAFDTPTANKGRLLAAIGKQDFKLLFDFLPKKGSCKSYELMLTL